MNNRDRVADSMRAYQEMLCPAFEALDGSARFVCKTWKRPGGGGGTACALKDGAVFEKAGVNVSSVHGALTPPALWQAHPATKGQPFFATGISMVLHCRNPYVPAFHANFRYFESAGESWFGGGLDLTPSYGFEQDARHFHETLRDYCARHGVDYFALKMTCDDYFTLKHRNETRGIGGIFFDEIALGTFDAAADFVNATWDHTPA